MRQQKLEEEKLQQRKLAEEQRRKELVRRNEVLDSRPRGRGFKSHWRHWVVVLEQNTFILA